MRDFRSEMGQSENHRCQECDLGDVMVKEIDLLRGLLRDADKVVIWEHTPARSGFQEEIEAALGVSGCA